MEKTPKIVRDFWKFHRENPEVLQQLLNLTERLYRTGRSHWGMKNLFEVLRWEAALQTKSDDDWKLNNNYTAGYARLIERRDLRFAGFFNERDSVFDDMFSCPEARG
jgi:hypothetical protein